MDDRVNFVTRDELESRRRRMQFWAWVYCGAIVVGAVLVFASAMAAEYRWLPPGLTILFGGFGLVCMPYFLRLWFLERRDFKELDTWLQRHGVGFVPLEQVERRQT